MGVGLDGDGGSVRMLGLLLSLARYNALEGENDGSGSVMRVEAEDIVEDDDEREVEEESVREADDPDCGDND